MDVGKDSQSEVRQGESQIGDVLRGDVPTLEIRLNGEPHRTSSTTVENLLEELKLQGRPVAVELNRQIIQRENYPNTKIASGDLNHFPLLRKAIAKLQAYAEAVQGVLDSIQPVVQRQQ